MNKSASIHVRISQDSPVSLILWLIYTNQLYKSNNHLNVRIPSYSDDIAIIAASKSVKENCNKLQNAVKSLVEWGKLHNVQFDVKKTELIHFDKSKKSMKYSVKFMNNSILLQELVKYLGVWFDRKLSFKAHVQKRIAAANRMFHSISRLANTERGLSFQAFRKLYIACITSVADYGVPVWWKNQQFLLDKFEKLQNSALRKILGAFRTSPIAAMKIEAGIAPVSVRFEKLCKNYALRILQMQSSHPVKQRASFNSPFSSENNGINLAKIDNFQLANWNQDISYSESETEPEFHSQKTRKTRRKKKKKKKKKKYTSQIFKICSHLKEQFDSISSSSSSDCEVEQFDSNWTFPWQKSAIKTEIYSDDKNAAASKHKDKILAIQQNHSENIIIYSDGSKLSETQTGAGSYISYAIDKQQSYYWHLNATLEAYDIELFAILKSLQQAKQNINSSTKNV